MGTSNNTLFTWGAGTTGQLGDNTITGKSAPTTTGVASIWSVQDKLFSSPVQVGTAKSWNIVAAGGSHTIATATDNTVWAWGQNNIGQLGDNTTVGKSSPTQIAGNTSSYTFITAGVSDTFAVRSTTALLFAWGQNNTGQLGDASTVAGRSSPVQVFAGTMTSPLIPIRLNTVSGSSYTQVQAGSAASVIDSVGRLFTWGTNTAGQIGDNTVVSRSSPVQLGGLQFTYINSPVQVGSESSTSYSQVSAGYSHTLAIDTNSLLYAWGKTPANGDTVTRSSPIQIGTNSWLNVSSGNDMSLAVDSTRTLYTWGLNTNYQLGSPNFYLNQSVTSPVAIGTLATTQNESSSGGAGNGAFVKNI
jgi:alpha-tubulin suppressor-like RCC1 family protein